MRRVAAVSMLLAAAQGSTIPTQSPLGGCPVGFSITTPPPTVSPSKSPSSSPVTSFPTDTPTKFPTRSPSMSPTYFPTVSPPTPVPFTPLPPITLAPQQVKSDIPNATDGLCRCEVFDNETMPFLDRNHSYCGHVPQVWHGAYHFTCPHCVEQGTGINITCPNNWETCELMINLYVCAGCSSNGVQTVNGLWPSSLAADGWSAASRCSSSFCSEQGKHPFVGFHKQIMGGDTEMLPETATDPTMYFSVLVMEGRLCNQITDATECQDAAFCQWDGSNCHLDWCPVGPQGPPPTSCGPCAPGTPDGDCEA